VRRVSSPLDLHHVGELSRPSSSARTRATLARWVASRLSRSTTWSVTSVVPEAPVELVAEVGQPGDGGVELRGRHPQAHDRRGVLARAAALLGRDVPAARRRAGPPRRPRRARRRPAP
jgi:hypothetical protein